MGKTATSHSSRLFPLVDAEAVSGAADLGTVAVTRHGAISLGRGGRGGERGSAVALAAVLGAEEQVAAEEAEVGADLVGHEGVVHLGVVGQGARPFCLGVAADVHRRSDVSSGNGGLDRGAGAHAVQAKVAVAAADLRRVAGARDGAQGLEAQEGSRAERVAAVALPGILYAVIGEGIAVEPPESAYCLLRRTSCRRSEGLPSCWGSLFLCNNGSRFNEG